MIKKHEMIEGAYYIGTCRNTNIAQWFNGEFIFINFHFKEPYIEKIEHYDDVKLKSHDGFIPMVKINVNVGNIVQERIAQDYKNVARKIYRNHNKLSMNNEVWEDIPHYEGLYYASNLGRIKKHEGDKIMKQNFVRDYLVVGLTDRNGVRKTCRVHRLVALAFKNNSDDTMVVNHINGIKTDNREINLEWVSHADNSKHTFITGNVVKKLTTEDVLNIKEMLNNGCVQKDVAAKFNVSRSTISEINTGKKWSGINLKK